jgi:hypothetical protein
MTDFAKELFEGGKMIDETIHRMHKSKKSKIVALSVDTVKSSVDLETTRFILAVLALEYEY